MTLDVHLIEASLFGLLFANQNHILWGNLGQGARMQFRKSLSSNWGCTQRVRKLDSSKPERLTGSEQCGHFLFFQTRTRALLSSLTQWCQEMGSPQHVAKLGRDALSEWSSFWKFWDVSGKTQASGINSYWMFSKERMIGFLSFSALSSCLTDIGNNYDWLFSTEGFPGEHHLNHCGP